MFGGRTIFSTSVNPQLLAEELESGRKLSEHPTPKSKNSHFAGMETVTHNGQPDSQ